MSQTETDLKRALDEDRSRYVDPRDFDDDEPRAIERRIDATRADMRATLEALERRLSMDRLIELTIGRVRDRGGQFAGNLTDAAAQNPVPLLLTSIGLGWMMLANRRGSRTSYAAPAMADRASGMAETMRGAGERMHAGIEGVTERMRGAAESARESVEHSAESLASGAARAMDATRDSVAQARERMDSLLEEQPLMLGAIGLAAGAILGAWLPMTEHEDRLLGDVRERAVRRTAETSRRRYEAAREQAATPSAPHSERFHEAEQPPARPH